MTISMVPMKVCTKCGNEWTLDSFSPSATCAGGFNTHCKPCVNEAVQARQRERRREMGEEAWLAHQREIQARHRQETGNEQGKAYNRARGRALTRLAELYPSEFYELLSQEIERGDPS